MKKLLVVARTDRGGLSISRARLDEIARELGATAVFQTAAKTGLGVDDLRAAIRAAIAWDELPFEAATDLLVAIERYLVAERESGAVLARQDDLYRGWKRANPKDDDAATFAGCVRLLESQGQLRTLRFGGYVLLQPELLDACAAAMVHAAKDEPDGLGALSVRRAEGGELPLPADVFPSDADTARLLRLATIEDLLACEVVFKESADDGEQLVFPAQLTRERPDLPDPPGRVVTYTFEGPIPYVYASLVVRLAHGGVFGRPDLWRNAAEFPAKAGGKCGVYLREYDDGRADLTVFHSPEAASATRHVFESYVYEHLMRKAAPDSVRTRRAVICPECNTPVSDETIRKRRAANKTTVRCGVCDDVTLSLDPPVSTVDASPTIREIDRAARARVTADASAQVIKAKRASGEYDVFLCHNSKEKPAVRQLARRLLDIGLLPWFDEDDLRPGTPWRPALEQALGQLKAAAVLVGASGLGPWQDLEIDALLTSLVRRGTPVIPVLLGDAPAEPALPLLLQSNTWIDLRQSEPDPFDRLVWGITGDREWLYRR